MFELDPFLYIALAAGLLVGRLAPIPAKVVDPLTLATVATLLAALGASLSGAPVGGLLRAIPLAVLLLGLTLGLTLLLVHLLPHRPGRIVVGRARLPYASLGFAVALVVGYAAGHASPGLPYAMAVRGVLYLLLFLVGLDIDLVIPKARELLVPVTGAAGGAVGAALLVTLATGTSLRLDLATTLGFGFYSLAGPLTAAQLGADAGLVALIANFLREDLTILLAPLLGPRLGPESLIAMGGATAMDTTLYSITHFADRRAAPLALGSGLVLTLAATLLVPLALSLPLP
jgi:uncharacterized membrane protein YbjE (DUF340 family)